MIYGAHAVLYSADAAADRAFLRDTFGWDHVDAGDGWLILALPPAEAAVHPSEEAGSCELYLMTDDLSAELDLRRAKGVSVAPITEGGGAR